MSNVVVDENSLRYLFKTNKDELARINFLACNDPTKFESLLITDKEKQIFSVLIGAEPISVLSTDDLTSLITANINLIGELENIPISIIKFVINDCKVCKFSNRMCKVVIEHVDLIENDDNLVWLFRNNFPEEGKSTRILFEDYMKIRDPKLRLSTNLQNYILSNSLYSSDSNMKFDIDTDIQDLYVAERIGKYKNNPFAYLGVLQRLNGCCKNLSDFVQLLIDTTSEIDKVRDIVAKLWIEGRLSDELVKLTGFEFSNMEQYISRLK